MRKTSSGDTLARVRLMPPADVREELLVMIHEVEAAYGRTPSGSPLRRAVARRLVALEIARQAVVP